MNRHPIVQGNLASPEHAVHCQLLCLLVELDFLIDAQQVAFLLGLAVFQKSVPMQTRDHSHAAVFDSLSSTAYQAETARGGSRLQ